MILIASVAELNQQWATVMNTKPRDPNELFKHWRHLTTSIGSTAKCALAEVTHTFVLTPRMLTAGRSKILRDEQLTRKTNADEANGHKH